MKPHGSVTRFRASVVRRIARAVREAGGGEMELNPVTGGYTIRILAKDAAPSSEPVDDLDNWMARRDARQA